MATAAEPGIVDAHLHIWQRSRFVYHWLEAGSALDRDFSLEDVREEMRALVVRGGILIEATNTSVEIPWLLEIGQADSLRWGVVGWIDLEHPDVQAKIDHFAHHEHFKGVRLNWLASRPQPERLHAAMLALQSHALVVDILTRFDRLPEVAGFIARYPDTVFVLDHLGGVPVGTGELEVWRATLKLFATLPNVVVKFSGYTTHDAALPTVSTLRDYLQAAVEALGVERLMFGSNYPICLSASSYSETVMRLREAASELNAGERAALFGRTALKTYRLL